MDIIVITICGAGTWDDIELFGISKEACFEQFLRLPHGIPSHDTFRRVFALLDAEQYKAAS